MNFLGVINFLTEEVADSSSCNLFGSTSANDSFISIVGVIRTVVKVLQILVPIALILWGTLDIGKAVIAGDEKKMKEAQKPFVKRLVAAILVFLVPFIVSIVMSYVGSEEWKSCWNAAKGSGLKASNPVSDLNKSGDFTINDGSTTPKESKKNNP